MNWPGEKWTGGADNAVLAPNALTTYGPVMAESVGRIHWAGTEDFTRNGPAISKEQYRPGTPRLMRCWEALSVDFANSWRRVSEDIGQVQGRGVGRRRAILRLTGLGGECRRGLLFRSGC